MEEGKNQIPAITVRATRSNCGRQGPKAPKTRYVTIVPRPGGGAIHYELKPAGLELVERLSREGRALSSIAKALGINDSTFRELRRRDPEAQQAVDRGRDGLGDELTDILLEQAREGVTVAAIFLAKARCGWREGSEMEGKTVNNTQINIQLTEPLSQEEFLEIVAGQRE
jgi:hypothetical protein